MHSGVDVIQARGGSDQVSGRGGKDLIWPDQLSGQSRNDWLFGGDGVDRG